MKKLAVALTYEAPAAPRVVAVGHGRFAERIVELAQAHGVPLKEDPALARALSTVEVDEQIPESLYLAVAEIIGFLLRAQSRPGSPHA